MKILFGRKKFLPVFIAGLLTFAAIGLIDGKAHAYLDTGTCPSSDGKTCPCSRICSDIGPVACGPWTCDKPSDKLLEGGTPSRGGLKGLFVAPTGAVKQATPTRTTPPPAAPAAAAPTMKQADGPVQALQMGGGFSATCCAVPLPGGTKCPSKGSCSCPCGANCTAGCTETCDACDSAIQQVGSAATQAVTGTSDDRPAAFGGGDLKAQISDLHTSDNRPVHIFFQDPKTGAFCVSGKDAEKAYFEGIFDRE